MVRYEGARALVMYAQVQAPPVPILARPVDDGALFFGALSFANRRHHLLDVGRIGLSEVADALGDFAAFRVIGIEQARVRLATHDRTEFPGKIVGRLYPRIQAESPVGWNLVRGIACQQQSSLAQ